jgi:prepilin-type N-terminal cleavage/methylation domain-containing protein
MPTNTALMSRPRTDRGFALIDLLFVIAIIGVIASMAMPGLLRARAQAGVSSAIGSLRVINSTQLTYAITCGSGFYAPNLTTLGTVPPGSTSSFVSADLGLADTVIKANFTINMNGVSIPGSPASCNGLASGGGAVGYRAGADAMDPIINKYFSTNTSGVIYEANVSLYATTPEAGPPAGGIPIG